MKATLHRALAPVPLVLLLASAMLDLLAAIGTRPAGIPLSMAHALLGWGVAAGVLASLTGIREVFVRRIPADALPWLVAHAGTMHLGLLCALVNVLLREPAVPTSLAIVLHAAGVVMLAAAALAGRTLARRCGLRR